MSLQALIILGGVPLLRTAVEVALSFPGLVFIKFTLSPFACNW